MPDNYLTPLAEMRPTPDAGFGSYAIEPIPAGTIVACFGGTLMDRATFDTMPRERRERSIQIDEDRFLLGPGVREPGDAVNHSCDPNCAMGGATQVVAMRDIAAGEELTFDYATSDGCDYDEFDCACGSTLCRGRVTGNDWALPELRQRYAGYFSPYLERRVAAISTARNLAKREVEALMSDYDTDPRQALQSALRIVSGRPHASFETLVELLGLTSNLAGGDITALDRLAQVLNETRGLPAQARTG
jgi:hypothetical protein